MQTDRDTGTGAVHSHQAGGRQRRLLVAGRSAVSNSQLVRQIFNGREVTVASRTKGLLDTLQRLEAGGIDLVLLNCECREEELELFVLDAQRRGFAGPILRLACSPQKPLPTSRRSRDSSIGHLENFPSPVVRKAAEFNALRAPAPFTQKERTVLMRVVEGWTSRQIARSMKCSESSVKAALQQIFGKVGVRRRSLVIRMACEGNLQGISRRPSPPSRAIDLRDRAGQPDNQAGGAEHGTSPIQVGDFVIDVVMHRAWVRGAEVEFSPSEFELLTYFSAHPEQLLRHEILLKKLWGNPAAARESLRVLIRALRAKIEAGTIPRYIVTQRNFGYRFVPSPTMDES